MAQKSGTGFNSTVKVGRRSIVVPHVHTFSSPRLKLGALRTWDVCESAAAEDSHLRHVVVLAKHPEERGVTVQSLGRQPVLQPGRMAVGVSPTVSWES